MMTEYELEYWNKNELVIGLDEAGRGPIAGPLVVAGVIFPAFYHNPLINDSKKLSSKTREQLMGVIIKDCLRYEVTVIEPKTIDDKNIYQATKDGMTSIILNYKIAALTDAMPISIETEVTSIIKGDQKSVSIAAASILAKVTRDKIMEDYDLVYPEYGFKKHKGYPTKQHVEALEKHGITPIHRLTFKPVSLLNQLKLDI